ncbi:MAG: ABC transporter permease [Gemmatimonadaceae bacterium]
MVNLKLAVRTLSKAPFVTVIAVVSLAPGIGANAAIFSLFDQMLLRALPVAQPERLVSLSAPGPKPGSQSCGQAGDCEAVFSYAMFRDLERAQTTFTGLAAHVAFGANLAYRNQTLNGEGTLVSGSYFPVLGLRPALGRLLSPADDQTVGAHFVAVLSHSYWETRLGSDPAVLNETIVVNGQPLTIIGVAPRGFAGTTLGVQPHVFVPISMRGLMSPGFKGFENRQSYWAYLFARLKPGLAIEQARANLNAIYKPIINDVEAPLQKGMSAPTMARFRAKTLGMEEGRRGQSSVHNEVRTPITLLFGITAIVLLIACANIANLLLARGANRAMEMAVRLSLGASRRQLLAQLLTESCLLAALGGLGSLVVARWTLGGIAAILPAEATSTLHLELSLPILLFAAALSLGTGLLFGMFPALHSTRPDLITAIRANTGQPSGARSAARFRTSLVTAQIALSMALLISAGLFIRSLMNVSRVDLGLNAENVVTFGISPELNGYTAARSRLLFERVESELAAVPGVTGVTAAMVALLAGNNWGSDVSVQGFKKDADTDANARFNEVGPAYFSTLKIPLLAGREFTAADGLGRPKVAVVNEAFAKKFNLGRDAVGKFMTTGDDKLDVQIVGLVRNAKYSEVKDEVPPLFFYPYRQDSTVGAMNFYVRTSLDPQQLLRTVPSVIKRLDPNLPLEELKTLPQQVRENVFLDRVISTLAATFAALATLLAAIGLYGVLAYTVAQRTREIGVRMALGADSRRVRGMVLRQVARMTIIGGVIGIAAALGLGRAARSLLYGLEGHDPAAVIAAAAVLALVAFGAGYIPARRASQVEPMRALRYE